MRRGRTRLIKSVKNALSTTVASSSKLTCQHLATIFAECEGIVNSRPIYCGAESYSDPSTITPNDLAIGRQIKCLPLDKAKVDPAIPFTRLQLHRKQLINKFDKTWKRDYLLAQQSLKFVKKNKPEVVKEGQIVLLRDKNLGKGIWKMARILELQKSATDGAVRRVKLKTSKGAIIDRHINMLSLTEADSQNL